MTMMLSPSAMVHSAHSLRGIILLPTATATPFSGNPSCSASSFNVEAAVSTGLLLTLTFIPNLVKMFHRAEAMTYLVFSAGYNCLIYIVFSRCGRIRKAHALRKH